MPNGVDGGEGTAVPAVEGQIDPIMLETPPDASASEAELLAKIDATSSDLLPAREGLVPPVKEMKDDTATEGTDGAQGDGSGADDNAGNDKDGTDVSADQGAAGEGGSAGIKPEKTPEPSDKSPEQTPSEIKAEVLTLTVKDAEGNEHKITKIEDLPEDFQPQNNRQALQILKDLGDLEVKQAKLNEEAAKAANEAASKAEWDKIQTQWDTEIAGLQKAGLLDQPKVKVGDPKYLEDPAVKRVDQVFKYMTQENERRLAAGEAPLRSFKDAFKAVRLEELEQAQNQAVKADNDLAKKKAGMIGGGGTPVGKADRPYFAGQAESVFDI